MAAPRPVAGRKHHLHMTVIDVEETMDVATAAARLRVAKRTVRRWLLNGELEGTRTLDGWTVSADAVNRRKTRPAPPGLDYVVIRSEAQLAAKTAALRPSTAVSSQVYEQLLRDTLEENSRLCIRLGAQAERISELERQLRALPAPAPQRWWSRVFKG